MFILLDVTLEEPAWGYTVRVSWCSNKNGIKDIPKQGHLCVGRIVKTPVGCGQGEALSATPVWGWLCPGAELHLMQCQLQCLSKASSVER